MHKRKVSPNRMRRLALLFASLFSPESRPVLLSVSPTRYGHTMAAVYLFLARQAAYSLPWLGYRVTLWTSKTTTDCTRNPSSGSDCSFPDCSRAYTSSSKNHTCNFEALHFLILREAANCPADYTLSSLISPINHRGHDQLPKISSGSTQSINRDSSDS